MSRVASDVVIAVVIAGCTVSTPSTAPTLSAQTATPAANATARPSPRIFPWIAYQTAEGSPHIRLARADGADDHELVTGSHPDWSPDGAWIAYEVDSQDIWVIRTDGTEARRLFECEAACVLGDSPAWSPDGRTIAFTTADAVDGKASAGRIAAVDVVTGKVRTLLETSGPDYPFYPRWSPDGKRLVLSVQRFETTGVNDCSPIGSAIGVVELANQPAAPQFLTDLAMYADYPDWSPDGSSIVFTTYDLGTRDADCSLHPEQPSDLYTVRPDGSGLTQLTHNPSGTALIRPVAGTRGTASGLLACQPSWAPDGQSITYVRVNGPIWPGTELWRMDPDGAHQQPIGGMFRITGEHPRMQPEADGG